MRTSSLPPPRKRDGSAPYRVCFVCTGNICRSPMAEVILKQMALGIPVTDGQSLADHIEVSSAGTGPWHVGEPMEPRARTALKKREYQGNAHVASQVDIEALEGVDLVVCLDRRHQETLRGLASDKQLAKRMVMLRTFDPDSGAASDVADPYYGEPEDFEECLAVIEASCRGLAARLAEFLSHSLEPSKDESDR